jgi:pyruvate-ferredoxin/flavodoxin oxidoreductase
MEIVELARPGGVFLLNAPFAPDEVWDQLPVEVREQIVEKRLRFFLIDAAKVAKATGMGGRINTVMQACFFAASGVLLRDAAVAQIKKSIQKTYAKNGEEAGPAHTNMLTWQ